MPKSSYLAWEKRQKADKDADTRGLIAEISAEHKGRYSYRRITAELHGRGESS